MTIEIADCMLRRMDALSDSMRTIEGACNAHKYAALEALNNMIEECARIAIDGARYSQQGIIIAARIRSIKAENPVYDLDR